MSKIFVYSFFTLLLLTLACKNRALHDGDEFKPRIIHEDELSFDRIEVDGIEYLILEKDYNNPHEGFGFMAFRANQLMEKQDSVLAYLRTIGDMQSLIYARLYNVSLEQANQIKDTLYKKNLEIEQTELYRLERSRLLSRNVPGEDSVKSEKPDSVQNEE